MLFSSSLTNKPSCQTESKAFFRSMKHELIQYLSSNSICFVFVNNSAQSEDITWNSVILHEAANLRIIY